MTHQIKQTTAAFRYTGPKFTPAMWNEVLSFFKWSYLKTHGESQVRLFVHLEHGWKAWAFPQEASCGLSTKELPDDPNTAIQRARFGDDWMLYGTVHHHCDAGAFQSGTDSDNEKTQEGIHITIGDMNKEKYSIHSRFYYRGCKFQPDLREFWDFSKEVRDKADEMADMFGVYPDLNSMAERQMVIPPPADTPFPEEWVANLIEKKWPGYGGNGVVYTGRYGRNGSQTYDENDTGYTGYPSKAIKMLRKWVRKNFFADELKAAGNKLTPEIRAAVDEELLGILENLAGDAELAPVLDAMKTHNSLLPEILKRFKEVQVLEKATPPLPADLQEEVQGELQEELAMETKKQHEMSPAEWEAYCVEQEQKFGYGA
jgi:restriction endonuclease Mrr